MNDKEIDELCDSVACDAEKRMAEASDEFAQDKKLRLMFAGAIAQMTALYLHGIYSLKPILECREVE